jgi:tetratricopeptide (TPR) repeat protein
MASDSIGYIYQHVGQPADAIVSYRRALAIFRDLGDRYLTAKTLDHLGDAHHAAGDPPHARSAWRQALVIYDDLDHPDGEALRQKLDQGRSP